MTLRTRLALLAAASTAVATIVIAAVLLAVYARGVGPRADATLVAAAAQAGDIAVTLRDGRLRVSDTGPGIPADDLPHVFERFYRSSAARSRPGSGLGLAIVKQVADQHGAAVTVESGPAGTSFTLALARHPIDPG